MEGKGKRVVDILKPWIDDWSSRQQDKVRLNPAWWGYSTARRASLECTFVLKSHELVVTSFMQSTGWFEKLSAFAGRRLLFNRCAVTVYV